MCVTCGCSDGAEAVFAGDHDYGAGHVHSHGAVDAHAHSHGEGLVHGRERDDAIDATDGRTIVLERAVLAKNDSLAERNRAWFAQRGILALNLVSSPGSGKTTLLERTIRDTGSRMPLVVIEGDQATENDSARIRAAGGCAVQVNTGTGCHLEAGIIARALEVLAPQNDSVVIVENVGNLVCPALFDLGERSKVTILSVTEGDDKPAKYPHMFAASDLLIINKMDLLPYVDFDVERCSANARAVRSDIEVIVLSATTGENMASWYNWISASRRRTNGARPASDEQER